MTLKHSLILPLLMLPALSSSAGSLFKAVELTDAEMAELRGRYVLPDRIISFGVTMTSSWQNSAGDVVGAQLQLHVGTQAQASLHVTPILVSGAGQTPASGTGQVIGGAGLNDVRGIVQSVRSAGDYNLGNNQLSIEISDQAGPAPSGQPLQGSQHYANGAGSVAVLARNGGLQIELQANQNQGYSAQGIGTGGIAQQSSISGVQNQVHNLAQLNVAMRDSQPGLDMANCAWEQMRGLRPTGY